MKSIMIFRKSNGSKTAAVVVYFIGSKAALQQAIILRFGESTMKMKRSITIFLAAAIALSSAAAFSGCQIKGSSPEDSYSSPIDRTPDGADSLSSEQESKADESTAEESKAEESEAASSEEKKDDKKDASSKKESPIYLDMVSLIKDENVLGYTVTKLVGSDDEHLIIAYGKKDTGRKDDTDTSNLIILDQEAYESELAEKEAARQDALEATKLFSVYKIAGNQAVPEGDIDGYYATPYVSPNTLTPGLYFARGSEWKYGLIELTNGSAAVNYSNEGSIKEEGDVFPPMPGDEVRFSAPDKFDLLEKYRYK